MYGRTQGGQGGHEAAWHHDGNTMRQHVHGEMKTKRKTVLIAAILAVILSLAVIFVIGLMVAPEKALLKIMADKVDLQIKNVRYTEVGDSGIKWEITADTARYLKRENLALFEKVSVRLVMKDGRTVVMNGDQGRLDTQSRDMEIDGNVGIVSGNGDHFATDRLRYRNAARQIETDQPVAMENGNVRISGVGMIFHLDEKKLTLLSQIRASHGDNKRGK
jgi:LPS export ABC transporter protein LptC